jgi:predicted phage terminase large subunit-like protein
VVNQKLELMQRMRADPLFMGRVIMPAMFSVPSCSMHRDMSNQWIGGVRFANWIAPRAHAKTSVVGGILPFHHLHFTPPPHVIVLCSKSEGHAIRILDTMKDTIEYSHNYRALFGYHGRHNAKKWTNTEIILDNGDVITTRGVQQQTVGLKYGHQRPTLIIGDDLEDLANTKTMEAVATNRKWLMTQVMPTLDPHRGRLWIVGTPQHQYGIVNHLHELSKQEKSTWKSFLYTAVLDEGEKKVLWPEWMSWDRLQEARRGMSASYYTREYLCKIVSEETQLFKEEMVSWYDGTVEVMGDYGILTLNPNTQDQVKKLVYIFMGIDPAVSTSLRADYSVIMPVAVDSSNNIYVLPFIRKRMPPSEVIESIKRMYTTWRPLVTKLETSGQQEIYRDLLTKVDDVFIPGLHRGHHPRDSKEKRYLAGLEPYFHRRKVHLLRGMEDLKGELMEFTSDNRHEHDDMIDALYYAVTASYAPPSVSFEEEEKPAQVAVDWMLS